MPCKESRTLPRLQVPTAHRALMWTWTPRKTTLAKAHVVGGLERQKDVGKASLAPHKPRLGSGSHHSRSRHRSGQPLESHKVDGALPHGAMRSDAQPRHPHAAMPACRLAHNHRRGSEHLWTSAMKAQPQDKDVTQLQALQEMTLSRLHRQDVRRQPLQGQQRQPRHPGRPQPTSHHKPLCFLSQLAKVRPDARRDQRKPGARGDAGSSQRRTGKEGCPPIRETGTWTWRPYTGSLKLRTPT